MDARLDVTRPWTRPLDALGAASLGTALTAVLGLLMPFVVAIMLARRLAGALVTPTNAAWLIVTGLAGAAAAAAIHVAMRRCRTMTGGNALAAAGDVVADVSLVALAVTLSLPGSSPPGIGVMWLAVVAEVAWWQMARHRHDAVATGDDSSAAAPVGEVWPQADKAGDAITQSLNYYRTNQGQATVSGWVHALFEAAQRSAFVHVAFCPAFDRPPQVEAEPLDGPSCRIRPTLVLPWGVRWEVKLDEPAGEPTAVVLGFTATEEERRSA